MVLSLGLITLVCGILLSVVYSLTEEPIALASKAKTQKAIARVLPPVNSINTCAAQDGTVYYTGLADDGNIAGYVVNGSSTGFGGPLRLTVGFRPDGTIFGVSVLEHSETPGLGAKCTDESFCGQFSGFNPAISTLAVRKDGGDVDAITASTITSRAFCAALENAVKTFRSIVPEKIEATEQTMEATDETMAVTEQTMEATDETMKEDRNNE